MLRLLMALDIGLLVLAFGAAVAVTQHDRRWLFDFFATRVSLLNCILFIIGLFLAHSILVMCNLYGSKRMSPMGAEAADVTGATILLTALLWCESQLFRISEVTPWLLLTFWVVATLTIIAARLLLRTVLRSIRKRGRNLHHVLVLGTNERALAFADMTQTRPERGFHLLGFVDDEWGGMEKFRSSGYPLVSNFDGLPEFLRRNVVDEIAIFLPLRSFYQRSAEIAQLAKEHGIIVRLDTDIFDLKFARQHAEAEATGGVPQIVASTHYIEGWQLVLKRVVDFVVSSILLILLSPLLLTVALLIKLTSPGPIFFAQTRIGRNKRHFTMYKFRTMVPTAESIQKKLEHLNEMSGPVFKIKNDPRITPIGRFLRRTSIDELPQLFNVLKGDMSLVGPRAIPVRDYQYFSEDWHRRRFSVPPGITCLWQVYGRNTIPFEQWMVLDMQYIDRWSLWLDLKILALTIPAVIRGSGAV